MESSEQLILRNIEIQKQKWERLLPMNKIVVDWCNKYSDRRLSSIPDPKFHIRIAVCGILNSGKSTFINEWLKGQVLLPREEVACTARLVHIVYSPNPYLKIMDSDMEIIYSRDNFDAANSEHYKGIKLEPSERSDNSLINRIVEIGIPAPLLLNGLEIIDTPGLQENRNLSKAVLKMLDKLKPDLFLYLYDVRKDISQSDIDLIHKLCRNQWRSIVPLILVANKIEIKNKSQETYFKKDNIVKKVQLYNSLFLVKGIFGVSSLQLREQRLGNSQLSSQNIFSDSLSSLQITIGEEILKTAFWKYSKEFFDHFNHLEEPFFSHSSTGPSTSEKEMKSYLFSKVEGLKITDIHEITEIYCEKLIQEFSVNIWRDSAVNEKMKIKDVFTIYFNEKEKDYLKLKKEEVTISKTEFIEFIVQQRDEDEMKASFLWNTLFSKIFDSLSKLIPENVLHFLNSINLDNESADLEVICKLKDDFRMYKLENSQIGDIKMTTFTRICFIDLFQREDSLKRNSNIGLDDFWRYLPFILNHIMTSSDDYFYSLMKSEERVFVLSLNPPKPLLSCLPDLSTENKMDILRQMLPFVKHQYFDLRPDVLLLHFDPCFRISFDPFRGFDYKSLIMGDNSTAFPFYFITKDSLPCRILTNSWSWKIDQLHKFGWLIWILIEGSGMKKPSILKSASFKNKISIDCEETKKSLLNDLPKMKDFPNFLQEAMITCWKCYYEGRIFDKDGNETEDKDNKGIENGTRILEMTISKLFQLFSISAM